MSDTGDRCFDCGGLGPCDVCENEPSEADDIALDLHRQGCITRGNCAKAQSIIEAHLAANERLATQRRQVT